MPGLLVPVEDTGQLRKHAASERNAPGSQLCCWSGLAIGDDWCLSAIAWVLIRGFVGCVLPQLGRDKTIMERLHVSAILPLKSPWDHVKSTRKEITKWRNGNFRQIRHLLCPQCEQVRWPRGAHAQGWDKGWALGRLRGHGGAEACGWGERSPPGACRAGSKGSGTGGKFECQAAKLGIPCWIGQWFAALQASVLYAGITQRCSCIGQIGKGNFKILGRQVGNISDIFLLPRESSWGSSTLRAKQLTALNAHVWTAMQVPFISPNIFLLFV